MLRVAYNFPGRQRGSALNRDELSLGDDRRPRYQRPLSSNDPHFGPCLAQQFRLDCTISTSMYDTHKKSRPRRERSLPATERRLNGSGDQQPRAPGNESMDGDANLLWTISGTPWAVTSTSKCGFSGVSYSTLTPGNPFSSPLLARAYTCLRSVASACSKGVAT